MLNGLTYPRSVALYDTDQALVYRGHCVSVRCSEQPSLSPKVDRTPSYYNNRRLLAWFEFTEIEDDSSQWLIARRCLYMPLADGTDTAWVVDDLSDLRRKEVTMWLLSAEVVS